VIQGEARRGTCQRDVDVAEDDVPCTRVEHEGITRDNGSKKAEMEKVHETVGAEDTHGQREYEARRSVRGPRGELLCTSRTGDGFVAIVWFVVTAHKL
jgi:hypothetical protein